MEARRQLKPTIMGKYPARLCDPNVVLTFKAGIVISNLQISCFVKKVIRRVGKLQILGLQSL